MKNKSIIILSIILCFTYSINTFSQEVNWYPGSTWFQPMPDPSLVYSTQVLSDEQKKQSMSYPNPIFLSQGNQQPILFYWLEEAQNIDIYIYNSYGNLLGKKQISQNQVGAQSGMMNQVKLGPSELNLYNITPGVYFYVIYSKDQKKVLYKGKIGVQP